MLGIPPTAKSKTRKDTYIQQIKCFTPDPVNDVILFYHIEEGGHKRAAKVEGSQGSPGVTRIRF